LTTKFKEAHVSYILNQFQSPCGRATVEALRLNRLGVVNLRRLLRNANLHPPENLEGIKIKPPPVTI
jgi:hypothetical protein